MAEQAVRQAAEALSIYEGSTREGASFFCGTSHHTKRDVEDALPYDAKRCHCEEYPKGTCFAARSDAAIRSPLASLCEGGGSAKR